MLFAYSYLARLREQLKGKVSISLVSDEETGYGRGTGYMFEQIENEMVADCVLTGEPSGAQAVCFASKGNLQFTVRVATRGAISGYPNESRSSIHIAAQIISELAELEGIEIDVPQSITGLLADPQWRERHDLLMGAGAAELLPKVTVNVGTIHGGSSPSVISSDCTFSVSVVLPVGIKQPRFASHTPQIKSVAPIRVARLTAKAASFDPKDVDPVIEPLFSRLYANVSNTGVTVGALAIAVFEIDENGNGRELIVTAAFPVGPNVVPSEEFEVVELPALEMAATTLHRGTVNTTAKTWNSLRRWTSKQGCRPKEIYRELYVIGAPNPESVWVTEMQQPVVRRT